VTEVAALLLAQELLDSGQRDAALAAAGRRLAGHPDDVDARPVQELTFAKAQRFGERMPAMLEWVRSRDRLPMTWGVIQGIVLLTPLIAPLLPFGTTRPPLGIAAVLPFGAWVVWVIRTWRGGR